MSMAQMTDNKSPQIIVDRDGGGGGEHNQYSDKNVQQHQHQVHQPEVLNEFSLHPHNHRHHHLQRSEIVIQEQRRELMDAGEAPPPPPALPLLLPAIAMRATNSEQVVDSVGGASVRDRNESLMDKMKNEKFNNGNHRGATTVNNKYFRTPQPQFAQKKKKWNKQFKSRQKAHQQINKADMENIQNLKNQTNHRKQQQQLAAKNLKQNFSKMNAHRGATPFSVRSKFFLPDKRPRKEIIIPPTKFLLGGNISDPLNLNSLQDEANATTPTQTPKQSPVTTPPKVEVIIPPNINDPLHLLDPVDSVEYEKQLVSPMKRKSKSKHRHRKKKAKRKRLDDSVSSSMTCSSFMSVTSRVSMATVLASIPEEPCSVGTPMGNLNTSGGGNKSPGSIIAKLARDNSLEGAMMNVSSNNTIGNVDFVAGDTDGEVQNSTCLTEQHIVSGDHNNGTTCGAGKNELLSLSGGALMNENHELNAPKHKQVAATTATTSSLTPCSLSGRRSVDRDKVAKDLRLDLGAAIEHQQHVQQLNSSGGGRKRRPSDGPNANKNKFRRLDSMDKIVSPVVPQPGAWKRPPRTVPTGARKGSRHHSTSISESELLSPTDETKTIESESIRGDTPDVETMRTDEGPLRFFHTNVEVTERRPKFKPEDEKYQFGNYDRYSGYRNLNELMDVRLKVFQRHSHLFRDKDILDVGCNVGHMTIAVAKNLSPKTILGIDIDRNLIQRARRNLSFYVQIPKDDNKSKDESNDLSNPKTKSTTNADQKPVINGKFKVHFGSKKGVPDKTHKRFKAHNYKSKCEKDKIQFFPISFPICYGSINNLSIKAQNKDESPAPSTSKTPKEDFPSNVFFRTENYVLKDESLLNNDFQQFDVIMCLSVTKWIHLNFGDTGLKLAFKRMFNQLRPGGKLILEAQNWASYKKKKNLTETIYNNYQNIEFFPNKFHEYLLGNEVGFSHSYPLGVPRHLSKGFCRPIQLYAKGDFTPNHIRWSDNYHPQTPHEGYRGVYAGLQRPQHRLWSYDTPLHSNQYSSCRQTPLYPGLSTSQYYNPLETDSYLPSYDTEVPNRHYCFASPLYQTVWSPPASLRNSSSHTPVYGSVRESDTEDGASTSRHVYPPNDLGSSPHTHSNGPFGSIRESDPEESNHPSQQREHVYANCINHDSTSPRTDTNDSSPVANCHRSNDQMENSDE